jgi:hypothetical protein
MPKDGRDASQDFTDVAASAADPVLVPIDIGIDVWFRSQGDLVRQVNDLCRFYMDTNFSKELEFDADAFEKTLEPPSRQPIASSRPLPLCFYRLRFALFLARSLAAAVFFFFTALFFTAAARFGAAFCFFPTAVPFTRFALLLALAEPVADVLRRVALV